MTDLVTVDRAWLTRHPVEVAWDLIGCVLTLDRDGTIAGGRIVETEAYAGPADPASHASRGGVARTVMAGMPGTIYTYLSYGIHTMMNIVAHAEGHSGAVLLRALEPTDGLATMVERRHGVPETQVARGPGSLGLAMGILLADLGTDILTASEWDVRYGESEARIFAGPRIGISKAVHARWRFFEHPSPYVSRHRKGDSVRRHELQSLVPPPGTPIE